MLIPIVENNQMENIGSAGVENHWWWALASAGQLGWGVKSLRQGFVGDSSVMPLKAFAVASLFVGAAATASISVLNFYGIHKVEHFLEVGANIRSALGIRGRVRDK